MPAATGAGNKEILMQNLSGKLSPHLVWLFALGAVAVGLGAAFATQGLGAKVTAAVYAGIVAIAGFASTFTTRARTRAAVLAFLLAALAAAALYYVVVSTIFATATREAVEVVSAGEAGAAGAEAGDFFGRFFGAFAAIVAFLETSIVGITGAVAGAKARGQVARPSWSAEARAA
jgi:hypothetical protein